MLALRSKRIPNSVGVPEIIATGMYNILQLL